MINSDNTGLVNTCFTSKTNFLNPFTFKQSNLVDPDAPIQWKQWEKYTEDLQPSFLSLHSKCVFVHVSVCSSHTWTMLMMMPIQQNQKAMLPKKAKMQPHSVYILRSMILFVTAIAQNTVAYYERESMGRGSVSQRHVEHCQIF